jgi:hypothetical protein
METNRKPNDNQTLEKAIWGRLSLPQTPFSMIPW